MHIKIETEETKHLSLGQLAQLSLVREKLNECTTLEAAAEVLQQLGWFAYHGGSHVACHRASGDKQRVLLITLHPQPYRQALEGIEALKATLDRLEGLLPFAVTEASSKAILEVLGTSTARLEKYVERFDR